MTATSMLADVCEITMGQAPSGESYNTEGEGLPLIAGAGDFGELHPAAKKHTTEAAKVCERDDIVLGIRASIGEKVIADGRYCLGRGVAGLRPRSELDGRYLWHWLTHINPVLLSKAKGATFLQVNRSDIGELPISLPPIPEQRRIAAILDKADALRTNRREALAQLDRLAQSIFVEMFGDTISPTTQWQQVPVSSFVAGFESGKSVAAEDEEDSSSQYRVLKVSAVTSLEFKPSESKAAPHDHAPQASHFVRPGDLLFSRANTTELIGATAYVVDTPDNLLLSDKLWRFVWHDVPRATPHFVNFLFRQPKFRAEIGRRASGSSGSMKNISQEKVMSIEVALPPLVLQKDFSARIEKVMRMKESQLPAADAADILFASLQYCAFRGEL